LNTKSLLGEALLGQKKYTDLDPLRARADFQKLIAELEKKAGK
jgi:hypothetical protein